MKTFNKTLIYTLTLFTPLIFLDQTTEFFDTPKLIFLGVGVLILSVIEVSSWLAYQRVTRVKTVLDLGILLLVISTILSAVFSQAKFNSLFGSLPLAHNSALAWFIYGLFFFLLTLNFKKTEFKGLLIALLIPSSLACLISLLSFLGVYLNWDFTHSSSFNLTGSTFATLTMAILLLPFLLISTVKSHLLNPLLAQILASFSLITIASTGNLPVYLATLTTYLLVILSQKKTKLTFNKDLINIFPSLGVGVLVVLLIFSLGPLSKFHQSFNFEPILPLNISWNIALTSLKDNPLLGLGPGTYADVFNAYKPAQINLTPLWRVYFNHSFDEYLELISTVGILGFLALTLLSVVIVKQARKSFREDNSLSTILSISSLMVVVLLIIHTTTLVSIFISIIIIAGLGLESSKVKEIKGLPLSFSSFMVMLALAVLVSLYGFKIILADYHHRLALNATTNNNTEVYNQLNQSIMLNPNMDLYRLDFAEVSFSAANNLAEYKGKDISDQDKKEVKGLLTQSVNEAVAATSLNPLSSHNWEVSASIYKQLTSTAKNALDLSMTAYNNAIIRDPANPLLRMEVGNTYYSLNNYNMAIKYFTDTVNLKPDYANGYYNLAIAYRDQGDHQNALTAAQTALNIVHPNSPDAKTISDLIDNIKSKSNQ